MLTPPQRREVEQLRNEAQTLRARMEESPGSRSAEETLARAVSLQTEATSTALKTQAQKHNVVKTNPPFRLTPAGYEAPEPNGIEEFDATVEE